MHSEITLCIFFVLFYLLNMIWTLVYTTKNVQYAWRSQPFQSNIGQQHHLAETSLYTTVLNNESGVTSH